MKWFTKSWWQYLLHKGDNPYFCSWFRRIICRINGYPNGCIYYNLYGYEPDDRCIDCGDYI